MGKWAARKTLIMVALLVAASGLFIACNERHLGYGVLLWALPERGLMDGDVLLVYIKSNISHVWVVSDEQSGEANGSKFEIPLWQMSSPTTKRKATAIATQYRDYQGEYARVMMDALPVRAEATNTARRVYRLKSDEVVKVLGEYTEADGYIELPANGGVPLDGKWLKVVTGEGTVGWCFSHNLEIFKVARGERVDG